MRFSSKVVAIPLSVTRIGVPPVLSQARRIVLPRVWVILLAELGRISRLPRKSLPPLDVRSPRALRSEPVAGVGLDTDEIVVARQLEKSLAHLGVELDVALARPGTVFVLQVWQC